MRTIKYYRTLTNKCPVKEFLDALPTKHSEKIKWVLMQVETLDPVPSQYFKKLVNTEDIWEVRTQFGGNLFRILCFFDGPALVILNHAFQKKDQKTPLSDIRLAEERKRDYLQRKTFL